MKKSIICWLGALLALQVYTASALESGAMAPPFQAEGADGKIHDLSALRGKYVVLEWFNKGCPYVRKHYDSKAMQNLQKEYTGKGVVWFTVLSSSKGSQGFATGPEAIQEAKSQGASASALLLDAEGKLGKLYGAKTTPHLFIIDPKGVLIYQGAIDDHPTSDKGDLAGATNYVKKTLDSALSGKKIEVTATKPYGCSVKYGN